MKKLIICLSFIALFSCFKDDINYSIALEEVCPNGSDPVAYCVSKSTYNDVKSNSDGRCAWVTFQDLYGVPVSGYYSGSSNPDSPCKYY